MNKALKARLNKISEGSLYSSFTGSSMIKYSFKVLKRFLLEGSILELGPAEGLMTEELIKVSKDVTVVEGSSVFSDLLRKKFAGNEILIINELFEDFILEKKFDNIILGHVLEHVSDPKKILIKIRSNLKDDGIIFCSVPNARSIHRQAAVLMGLINSEFEFLEKDKHHGHMRIYNPETLRKEFIDSGYKIKHFGGYWLKPISDRQIEENWDEKMLDAFMCLG
ncbi:MAG: class I SAM-dependent methyltransferase, partial [Bacteroidales bacterium]